MKVAVIGGGISGLSAAHRCLDRAPFLPFPVDLTVIEAADRVGGSVGTSREATPEGPLLVEWGADAFITEKPWALDLARRLDLAPRMIAPREGPGLRRALVVRGGRLWDVPEGFLLLAPTRARPILRSPLFSPAGKLRMALDLVLPRGTGQDESIGAFVRRRLGRECYERLAQPLVSAIYGGDPDRLSLRVALPQFAEMERRHGSAIRGLRAAEVRRNRQESGARYDLFATFEAGMQTLVDALASRIGADRIRRSVEAKELRPAHRRWEVILGSGERLAADAVIVALPPGRAAALLRGTDAALAETLSGIPTISSTIVTLAWRREEIPHPLDAFGHVVPRAEGRRILAASFSSRKFPTRAPEGVALVRAFVGGGGSPDPADAPDAALLADVREELGDLIGARAAPFHESIHRHPRGMPQLETGHEGRVTAIREAVSRHAGLALAGNYFTGVGVPDSVRSGEAAAEAILGFARSAAPEGSTA